ncbi:MAG: flagellar basal body P-ring formation chaperone FlgA [Deltaproteobacteria bacterium]|nr:flagellar basal body P-ring formation chaperone FlgA [Deltaproteobacteria bacterium]
MAFFILSQFIMADHEVKIIVGKSAEVSSGKVYLKDIAEITPIKNLELATAIGKVLIVDDLEPGKSLFLSSEEILGNLRRRGFNLDAIGYVLPPTLEIYRKGSPPDYQHLKALLSKYLESNQIPIKPISLRVSDEFMAPVHIKDAYVEKIDISQHAANGLFTFVDESGSIYKVSFEFRFKKLNEVAVFTKPLKRGERVMPEVIQKVFMEDRTGLSFDRCVNRIAKYDLTTDTVCSDSNTEKEILVKRKDPVEVVYKSGVLEIKMSGSAMNDASVGDTLNVKNPTSGKVVTAIVKEDGIAYVY